MNCIKGQINPYITEVLLFASVFVSLTEKNRPRGYTTFLISPKLSMKLILLINLKMPTIVGILTFISRLNTASERLKAINSLFGGIFSVY